MQLLRQYGRGQDPCRPDWHGDQHHSPYVLGLPVVVPVPPGLEGEGGGEGDEEDDVEEGEDVVSGGVGAEGEWGGGTVSD